MCHLPHDCIIFARQTMSGFVLNFLCSGHGVSDLNHEMLCSLCLIVLFIFTTLFIQVIAASTVAFIGIGFAILLISVLAVVILWFYGSFWTTSSVIIFGGNVPQLIHNLFGIKLIWILQFINAEITNLWYSFFGPKMQVLHFSSSVNE